MTSWSWTAWGIERTAAFFIISGYGRTPTISLWRWRFRRCSTCCARGRTTFTGAACPTMYGCCGTRPPTPGRCPSLEKLVAVIRSREVSLTLFYQAQLAQCKAIYDRTTPKRSWAIWTAWYSWAGREALHRQGNIRERGWARLTISMQTDSRSRGQSESYSQNNQRLGRELMTTERARDHARRQVHYRSSGGYGPFSPPKYDLKQHPNYRYTAEADKRKTPLTLTRLINRRMEKLDPDELCEVYARRTVPDDGDHRRGRGHPQL